MATSVLGQGAFQGGWVWGRVDEAQAELGPMVHRPALCGCGLQRGQPIMRAQRMEPATQTAGPFVRDAEDGTSR